MSPHDIEGKIGFVEDKWYHIAIVRDATHHHLYVDGEIIHEPEHERVFSHNPGSLAMSALPRKS